MLSEALSPRRAQKLFRFLSGIGKDTPATHDMLVGVVLHVAHVAQLRPVSGLASGLIIGLRTSGGLPRIAEPS